MILNETFKWFLIQWVVVYILSIFLWNHKCGCYKQQVAVKMLGSLSEAFRRSWSKKWYLQFYWHKSFIPMVKYSFLDKIIILQYQSFYRALLSLVVFQGEKKRRKKKKCSVFRRALASCLLRLCFPYVEKLLSFICVWSLKVGFLTHLPPGSILQTQ